MYTRWKQCFSESPHEPHEWFYFWKRSCEGLEILEPLDRDKLYRNHKHNLWLSGWSGKAGRPITHHDTVMTFTCRDGCKNPTGEHWSINIHRWKYNDLVLNRTGIYQTWPG